MTTTMSSPKNSVATTSGKKKTVAISVFLHTQAKIVATREGIPFQDWIAAAIKEKLSRKSAS
jgi:predicted HicB family RNase H-like nuclease